MLSFDPAVSTPVGFLYCLLEEIKINVWLFHWGQKYSSCILFETECNVGYIYPNLIRSIKDLVFNEILPFKFVIRACLNRFKNP